MTTTRTMSSTLKRAMIALVLLAVLTMLWSAAMPKAASAYPPDDTVLEWNRHAVDALNNPPTAPTPGIGQPPQIAVMHLAMVQGAIYDAVNMIEGGYQPYLVDTRADANASTAAAVATAAHEVLVGLEMTPPLSPAVVSRLDSLLADSIAAATAAEGTSAVNAGIAAGEAAAAAMLADRAGDGRYVPLVIEPGTEPGDWRPTPPTNGPDPYAWVGRVDPFTLESGSQFRTKGPNDLKTGIYAKDYEEVRTLGSPMGVSQRTPEQDALATFFAVNPLELYNRAFRDVASAEELTIMEQARLFAMLNMAGADALINCFNDKEYWSFWRPYTAIRLGDFDGNDQTVGDPNWVPMAGTPAYSEHPSGYNCVTAAFMHTAEAFFGKDKTEFSLVKFTPGAPAITRVYDRYTDVIDDTIDARIYQGLHFRTSDVQGAGLGKDVARWLDKHFFQPTN